MLLSELKLDKSDFTITWDCVNPDDAPEPWGNFNKAQELFIRLDKNAHNYEVLKISMNDGSDSYFGKPMVELTLKYIGPKVKKEKKYKLFNDVYTENEYKYIKHKLEYDIKEIKVTPWNAEKEAFTRVASKVLDLLQASSS